MPGASSLPRGSLLVLFALGLAGCGDLKSATLQGDNAPEGGASDAGSAAETSPTEPGAPGTGPGPAGALPSGYCCADDVECRSRQCVAVSGGTRMCLDRCRGSGPCSGDLPFTCDGVTPVDPGTCQPPSAGFACLPAASFRRGTRAAGECCDGHAGGAECDGNLCVAHNAEGQDNPFVCSQGCATTRDCPSSMICFTEVMQCIPGNLPYVCK